MSAIELRGVSRRYGATPVLEELDLVVTEGSMTAVLGPSGSGKTTLLRLIAGFDRADSGSVTIGGRVVDDGRTFVSPQHRGIGYVPQEGALFPHLTVAGNIGFGVHRRNRGRVRELVELVGLTGLERRYPHQLSGGQQQRAALARALAIAPKVVLLDEPFSSLDASLRTGVRRDVLRILSETGTTAVLVTHDQDEALAMSDQIAVLRHGRVAAAADPRALYFDPPDLIAAASLGEANVLAAKAATGVARCVLGAVRLEETVVDGPGLLLLRPEQLVLHAERTGEAMGATVVELQYHGHDALVSLIVDGEGATPLLARVPGEFVVALGAHVFVEVRGLGRMWPTEARRA